MFRLSSFVVLIIICTVIDCQHFFSYFHKKLLAISEMQYSSVFEGCSYHTKKVSLLVFSWVSGGVLMILVSGGGFWWLCIFVSNGSKCIARCKRSMKRFSSVRTQNTASGHYSCCCVGSGGGVWCLFWVFSGCSGVILVVSGSGSGVLGLWWWCRCLWWHRVRSGGGLLWWRLVWVSLMVLKEADTKKTHH